MRTFVLDIIVIDLYSAGVLSPNIGSLPLNWGILH
jgi:hypothetical protein